MSGRKALWIASGAACVVMLATAWAFLATRLVFVPVPWADGSAFYLPALEWVHWPPVWRMHAQAAFVPSYDQANFNLMPALPLLLGTAAALGLPSLIHPELLIRILSLPALLGWAWLLWSWLLEALGPLQGPRRAHLSAGLLTLAALWNPSSLGHAGRAHGDLDRAMLALGAARALSLGKMRRHPAQWSKIAWRISAGLALSAYFHFEAAYFVPATIVGLGFSTGWSRRLVGVATRSLLLLSPWLIYVSLHPGLFAEQMQVQFHRLSHHNHWMANPYLIFHSLFIDHGSPAGWPQFFNLAKGIFWLGLAGLSTFSAGVAAIRPDRLRPRRALFASGVAFVCCFYLWATKAEVWFITLCHLTFWPWAGAALILAIGDGLARRAINGLAGALLFGPCRKCRASARDFAGVHLASLRIMGRLHRARAGTT